MRLRERSEFQLRGALLPVALVFLLATSAFGCRKKNEGNSPSVAGPPDRFTTVKLLPSSGPPVEVRAELAVTERERNVGLMYRGHLDAGAGMLFVFERPQVLGFWMRNTLIPLDMIFISSKKKVVGVVHNAQPRSLETRGVGMKLSQYVLEVNGGFAKKHSIKAGTPVEFTLPRKVRENLSH